MTEQEPPASSNDHPFTFALTPHPGAAIPLRDFARCCTNVASMLRALSRIEPGTRKYQWYVSELAVKPDGELCVTVRLGAKDTIWETRE